MRKNLGRGLAQHVDWAGSVWHDPKDGPCCAKEPWALGRAGQSQPPLSPSCYPFPPRQLASDNCSRPFLVLPSPSQFSPRVQKKETPQLPKFSWIPKYRDRDSHLSTSDCEAASKRGNHPNDTQVSLFFFYSFFILFWAFYFYFTLDLLLFYRLECPCRNCLFSNGNKTHENRLLFISRYAQE